MSRVQHPQRRRRPQTRVVAAGVRCAELEVVMVDGPVLYWPGCGHALDDEAALYDRPLCVVCEPD